MYDYENSPEPELIRRARRGDIKAFSTLYAGIYKDLYRFALCTTRHVQDAEDAVSETVAAAYENIGKLRKEDSFRSWMFTILNNQCRKILRAGTGLYPLMKEMISPEIQRAQQGTSRIMRDSTTSGRHLRRLKRRSR